MELTGFSVSVFDAEADLWRQTWVDDQGSYFALTGGTEGDTFVLRMSTVRGGEPVELRMVFCEIGQDSFCSMWERSLDAGATSSRPPGRSRTRAPRDATVRAGRGSPYNAGRADVAQLVEHFTRNEGVRGSSPRVGLADLQGFCGVGRSSRAAFVVTRVYEAAGKEHEAASPAS